MSHVSSVCLSWLQRGPDVTGWRWELFMDVQHLTQQPVNEFVFNRVFRDEARTWVSRLQGLCQMKSATTWLPPAGTCQSSWTECEARGSQRTFVRAGWSLLLESSALNTNRCEGVGVGPRTWTSLCDFTVLTLSADWAGMRADFFSKVICSVLGLKRYF